MIYECKGHHLSLEPGTCHADGCFRKLHPKPEASPKAKAAAHDERVSALALDEYVRAARGHGPRWWLQ